MTNDKSSKYDHAWRYFELHATQRISLIRYYVVVLSLYVTGSGYLVAKFSSSSYTEEMGVIFFSIIFTLITAIFWLLDNRNRKLIHLAEKSLRKYEKNSKLEYVHKIFIREQRTARCSIRHTHCFAALFIIAIGSAILIILYSWCHIYNLPNESTPTKTTAALLAKQINEPFKNLEI